MTEDIDAMRKRLMYRAHHRGTKEMDLILGPFAEAHLAGYDAAMLSRFEAVLEEADQDFMSWITGQSAVPADADHELVVSIIAFARKGLAR